MVVMLGRPCAFCTTSSGSNPCSRAHPAHARATAGGESTSTPSRSKSTPRQRMLSIIHDRQKVANCEMRGMAIISCLSAAGCKRWMPSGGREAEWRGRGDVKKVSYSHKFVLHERIKRVNKHQAKTHLLRAPSRVAARPGTTPPQPRCS